MTASIGAWVQGGRNRKFRSLSARAGLQERLGSSEIHIGHPHGKDVLAFVFLPLLTIGGRCSGTWSKIESIFSETAQRKGNVDLEQTLLFNVAAQAFL